MTVDQDKFSRFLEKVAEEIDIPPAKYRDAVESYQSVGRWLEGGTYPGCFGTPSIYPQGSFRLGTVVRPIRGGVDASYDIDLVCELPIAKDETSPRSVKTTVGERLLEHGTYRRMLDEEGKRCWTLQYSEEDGAGFHMDVLPSVPDPRSILDTSIAITSKREVAYDWSASNPKGYGLWFDGKNQSAFALVRFAQKRSILARAPDIYARVDDVPDQLVRTPLQRSIQLMKRHRDMRFNNARFNGYAPISIIITTLAAQFYGDESDVYAALTGIISKLRAQAVLIDNVRVDQSLIPVSPIQRTPDGKWYIGNPVNPDENFADRWHEDSHARAKAFFKWVEMLQADLVNILCDARPGVLAKGLSDALGTSAVSDWLELIVPVAPAIVTLARIHISGAAKPWRA